MFVFPMAGKSSRFFNAGYSLPKYQLPLGDRNVFSCVIDGFSAYFEEDEFLFIGRKDQRSRDFVERELELLGVKRWNFVELDFETSGQAQTVIEGALAVEVKGDEELYIFNIDSVRCGFEKRAVDDLAVGYLEVFQGEGVHWSFVCVDRDGLVTKTAEKIRISDLCSNGLYYFSSFDLFRQAYEETYNESLCMGESYIAPMYNQLVKKRHRVECEILNLDQTIFVGTPEEYKKARLVYGK